MPAPVLKPEDLTAIVERAMFLERTAHSDIAFDADCRRAGDAALRRAAHRPGGRSTSSRTRSKRSKARIVETGADPPGRIAYRSTRSDGQIVVTVETTARACRSEGRERLTEPYVTTRAKGTGLGLAIVKKIMEDHQGELVLEDREPGGARVTLVFAATPAPICAARPSRRPN